MELCRQHEFASRCGAPGACSAWLAANDRAVRQAALFECGLVRQSQIVGFNEIDRHGAIFPKGAIAVVARALDRGFGGKSKGPTGCNMDRGSCLEGFALGESVASIGVRPSTISMA